MVHFALKAQVFERSKFNFIVADCKREDICLKNCRYCDLICQVEHKKKNNRGKGFSQFKFSRYFAGILIFPAAYFIVYLDKFIKRDPLKDSNIFRIAIN